MMKTKILSCALLLLCLIMTVQFVACDNGSGVQQSTTGETERPETEGNTTDDSTDTPSEDAAVATKPSIDFDKTVQVTENDASASVTTALGLQYSANGYQSYANGAFAIRAGYTVDLKDQFANSFNRLTLCYVSDAPLECTVIYKQGSKTVKDLFYLEAGKQTFCALVQGYLSGAQATDLTSITFDTCEDKNASFVLCDVKTEVYEVYSDDVFYIENESYKLGVRLSWGGGICYLKDLKKKVGGVDNLINQADTGRLVQQSYYGTYGNGEYKDGDYNGVRWPYNPVQGGDVHGNPSRIIDIVVGNSSLYIKAQPQDWGHDGELTPSYMENTYILEKNYVRVDNRFVDFSGWEHRFASQELPAFYTLSYFDEFSYYGGSKPWQDQPLSTRDDLNFWGDPAYGADCTFKLRYSNTETWCAWTNGLLNYGVGLYVPGVDVFFAGRHAYNASKDSADGATNYVAPLCTMKLVSFQPIEYSYMMATGSLEQIRSTFKQNKDFATNETLHNNYISERIEDEGVAVSMEKLQFNQQSTALKLLPTNNTSVSYDSEKQAAELKVAAASDPHVTLDYTKSSPILNAQDYTKILITYMIPKTNSNRSYIAELFLATGSTTGAEGGKSVRAQVVADGEYHTLEIKVSGLSFWSGNVNAIRFDYFDSCAEGDVIYIQSIELQ